MSMNILPGSYPPDLEPSASTSQIFDHQFEVEFKFRQLLNRKTRHQHDLFYQIDAVVYCLAGFQFIRYCHLACLIPTILHVVTENIMNRDLLEDGVWNQLDDSIRAQFSQTVEYRSYILLWMKALFTVVYHVVFVVWYLVPMVDAGLWSQLGNGGWWFVSFIGEEISEIDPKASLWSKMVAVGLWQLIISDGLIAFCQLALYQAVFRQSKLNDHRLDDKEVNYVRSKGDTSGVPDDSIDPELEVPMILNIKLGEDFDVWHRLQGNRPTIVTSEV